jgi:hypothetical protein
MKGNQMFFNFKQIKEIMSNKSKRLNRDREILSYDDADRIVKMLRVHTSIEYLMLNSELLEILKLPSRPDVYYRGEGWRCWEEFLGTKTFFVPYKAAKELISGFKLSFSEEYKNLSIAFKKENGLPQDPYKYYKNSGWVSWRDFLSINSNFPSYEEAKAIAINLGIKSSVEWYKNRDQIYKETGLPPRVDFIYRDNGWMGWGDFLGQGKDKPRPRAFTISYSEAKAVLAPLRLKNRSEYEMLKRSFLTEFRLPVYPSQTYRNSDWVSWDDFLSIEK